MASVPAGLQLPRRRDSQQSCHESPELDIDRYVAFSQTKTIIPMQDADIHQQQSPAKFYRIRTRISLRLASPLTFWRKPPPETKGRLPRSLHSGHNENPRWVPEDGEPWVRPGPGVPARSLRQPWRPRPSTPVSRERPDPGHGTDDCPFKSDDDAFICPWIERQHVSTAIRKPMARMPVLTVLRSVWISRP